MSTGEKNRKTANKDYTETARRRNSEYLIKKRGRFSKRF
jgi:hypothetical protein